MERRLHLALEWPSLFCPPLAGELLQIRVGRVSAGSGVVARVVAQSFYGAETVLRLELADGSGTAVTARTFDVAGAEPGDEVSLVVEGPVAVYRPAAVTT